MTNSYFNYPVPIPRFTTADATRLNSTFSAIAAAFDKIPSSTEITQGTRNYAIATNVGGAYSITLPIQILSYEQGLQGTFFTTQANPAGATLSVNGISPATLRRWDGTNILANDIKANSINTAIFDGTGFRLISVHGASETLATTSATSASTSASNAAASASQAATSASSASTSATAATQAAATVTGIMSNARFGDRNTIINPLFWMSQRQGAQTPGLSYVFPAGIYVRDRWKAGPSGLTYSITSSTMTITAGNVVQVIQGRNLPFAGQYTLSWTGTSSATVNGTAVTNGGQITLTPGFLNATISFGPGTLYIPQFEFSPEKTQFELRSTDNERLLCFQYCQKSYDEFVVPGTVTHTGVHASVAISVGELAQPMIYLQVPMRATPSIGIYNPRFLNLAGSMDNMETFQAQGYTVEASDKRFQIYYGISTFTIGNRYRFHWIADAEL